MDKQDIINQIGMVKCTLIHLRNKEEIINSPKLTNNLEIIKNSIEIIEEGVRGLLVIYAKGENKNAISK